MTKSRQTKGLRADQQVPTVYQSAVPIKRIQARVEDLHEALDAFVTGRTDELKGQRTRDTLNSSLTDIDAELMGLQQVLSKKSSSKAVRVVGVASAESAELARKVDEHVTIILHALHPYTSGQNSKPLSKATRSTVNLLWPEIRRNLDKLQDTLGS